MSIYKYDAATLAGETVSLETWRGRVLLIVNTASACGFTPQYAGLEALYRQYELQGLTVLGFPCNQFGAQEPGSSKVISDFCTKEYGIKFDMFEKIEVNGKNRDELYKYLTAQETKPAGKGDIKWNFEKFLVGRDGKVVARFAPKVTPESDEVVAVIEKELAKESKTETK